MTLFRDLKKRTTLPDYQIKTLDALCVGNDWDLLRMATALTSRAQGSANVVVLSEELATENLCQAAPSLWRVPLRPTEATNDLLPARFIKEGEVQSFESRIKPPMTILPHEEFFKMAAQFTLPNELDSSTTSNGFNFHKGRVEWIDFDAANPATPWQVSCNNGVRFHCAQLFWGQGLAAFIKVFRLHNQDQYPEIRHFQGQIAQFAKFNPRQQSLVTTYALSSPLAAKWPAASYLIPQSLTHEQGHFVVEYLPSRQQLRALVTVSEEENDAELIARKLKLLKRTLRRQLDLRQEPVEAQIILTDKIFTSTFKYEELRQQSWQHVLPLFLLGMDAPLVQAESDSCQGWIRQFQNFKQILQTITKDHHDETPELMLPDLSDTPCAAPQCSAGI